MNLGLEEKLADFSAEVLSEAQKKRAKIEAENKKIEDERIEKATDEFLQNAYVKIQKTISDIKKIDNKRVLTVQNDARQELLVRREEIINSVFDKVKNKILDFIKSQAYEDWMIRKIKDCIALLGDDDLVIYVKSADEKTLQKCADQIKSKIQVEKAQKDIIGGFIIENRKKNVLMDCSFDELIDSQRATFLQKSGLIIE